MANIKHVVIDKRTPEGKLLKVATIMGLNMKDSIRGFLLANGMAEERVEHCIITWMQSTPGCIPGIRTLKAAKSGLNVDLTAVYGELPDSVS